MSEDVKVAELSERVNVIVAVSPGPSEASEVDIAIVGVVVSAAF